MIRIVVIIALLVASGRETAAQDAPKLKELVTVTADVVRIGDLVENAGPSANVAVFRAPDLGQTGAVQVERVAQALKPHEVTGFDTGGLSEVVVTRLSRLPRAVPFLVVLALLVGGILVPGWGWVLTALVALFLAWMLVLGWPRLSSVERLMRIAVIFMAVAIAVSQAIPRA